MHAQSTRNGQSFAKYARQHSDERGRLQNQNYENNLNSADHASARCYSASAGEHPGQLDQIAQAERDAEGAYSTDAIMRQAEADRAAWERQLQATAQQNFRDCVELGSSPAECARFGRIKATKMGGYVSATAPIYAHETFAKSSGMPPEMIVIAR